MTKKQIIERLKAAGVKGYDGLNLAALEALAEKNGVSLSPDADEGAQEGKPAGPVEGETGEMVEGDETGAGGMNSSLTEESLAETKDRIGDREVKVRPSLEGDGWFQAVCEEFPDLVGEGNSRLNAVEDLAEAISAKLEGDAIEKEHQAAEDGVCASDYNPLQLVTPQMAVASLAGDPTA